MWEVYYSASTIDEALAFLDKHGSEARVVAGGTDLILELESGGHPDLKALIDITRIPDLDTISLHGDRIARLMRAPDGFAVEHDAASGDLYLRPAGEGSGHSELPEERPRR